MQIVELRNYLLSMNKQDRIEFAKKCGTTYGQMMQIYRGNRTCHPTLAIEIDKHSKGCVKCDVLSPDTDFNYVRANSESV
ncbi:hypothetical protein SQ00_04275 [Moraxella catarrhalis]|nr:hypothetical protein SQ00_04275 [Moraxella catarrhalis]EGE21100.1 hypothetical protein E9S_05087 [Moraxella catarrhalis BC7]OAV28988.1 hypothetical protein AO369_0371 [Moraxella catarrhalis]